MKFPLFNTAPGQMARVIEAQAKAHPEMMNVRVSPFDYHRAGFDRNGPATAIAVRPERSFAFNPPALADLSPMRRVYVERDHTVEPGEGWSP